MLKGRSGTAIFKKLQKRVKVLILLQFLISKHDETFPGKGERIRFKERKTEFLQNIISIVL